MFTLILRSSNFSFANIELSETGSIDKNIDYEETPLIFNDDSLVGASITGDYGTIYVGHVSCRCFFMYFS